MEKENLDEFSLICLGNDMEKKVNLKRKTLNILAKGSHPYQMCITNDGERKYMMFNKNNPKNNFGGLHDYICPYLLKKENRFYALVLDWDEKERAKVINESGDIVFFEPEKLKDKRIELTKKINEKYTPPLNSLKPMASPDEIFALDSYKEYGFTY